MLALACGAPQLAAVPGVSVVPDVHVYSVAGCGASGDKTARVAVAAAEARRKVMPRLPAKWVLDTGCGFDLIGLNDVSEADKAHIVDALEPVVLHTAGGEVNIDKSLPLHSKILGQALEPLVLKSTPAVLSLGRRCRADGYDFRWRSWSECPVFKTPQGHKIPIEVINDVPFARERPDDPASDPAVPTIPKATVNEAVAEGDVPPPPVPCPEWLKGPGGGSTGSGGDGDVTPQAVDLDEDQSKAAETRRNLQAEAKSLAHQLTHLPKNPWCPACQAAKMNKRHARRKKKFCEEFSAQLPRKFGDSVTADHLIARREDSQGFDGAEVAMVIMDLAKPHWVECHPQPTNSELESTMALQHFAGTRGMGPKQSLIKHFYSDGAKELTNAAHMMGWNTDSSRPYRSQNNAVVERMVRHVEEGTRTILSHAGLGPEWWPLAVKHFCHCLCVTPDDDGKTAWKHRHTKEFDGKMIPFGAFVHFLPPPHLVKKIPKFGTRGVPGIFVGWYVHSGGEWKREYVCCDLRDFRRLGPKGTKQTTFGAIRYYRVQEVFFDNTREPFYPFREARDRRLLDELDLSMKAGVEDNPYASGQGGDEQVELDVPHGGGGDAAPRDPQQPVIKVVKGAKVFHTLTNSPDEQTLWRRVVCRETYEDTGDPEHDGELIERLYVKGMKPKKLCKPIPGADQLTGRDVKFVFHFTDPLKEKDDDAKPDDVEDHASAGDGDAAADPMQNGAPQEEIEGFIRRCGNVVFTEKHEIIDGNLWVERRRYKTRGRCPGIHPLLWGRFSDQVKDQYWSQWLEKYGPPPPIGKQAPAAEDGDGGDAVPPAPAAPGLTGETRTIVEYCTGVDSRLGRPRIKSSDCKVVRLTINEDLRTPRGREIAKRAVCTNPNVLLWVAIPCTGGCPWNYINAYKGPDTVAKIQQHRDDMKKMWENLMPVADANRRRGGRIAIEWPSANDYWKLPFVEDFMVKFGLYKAKCQGCAYGLCDDDGTPIKKPWTIATDDAHLACEIERGKCPGHFAHPNHAPCSGKYTKKSEGYTDAMARAIHRGWRASCMSRAVAVATPPRVATPAVPVVKARLPPMVQPPCADGIHAIAAPAMPPERPRRKSEKVPRLPLKTTTGERQEHRPKDNPWPVFSALVARPVTKTEREKQPKAQEAMLLEAGKLAKNGVWDLDSVMSLSKAKARAGPRLKVHIARVFGLCVLKGSELPEGHANRKYKGRYVLQGNDVRDEEGDVALFNELSSSPATLEAAKAVDAVGLQEGYDLQQADAQQAYTQAEMGELTPVDPADPSKGMVKTETWVILPPECRPKSWGNKYHCPVVRLKKALYGHADSGGYWERHCDSSLRKVGFAPVPNWPSVYHHAGLDLTLMVYVDDFKMAGPKGNLAAGWRLIQKHLNLDEPGPVNHCLGCRHRVGTGTVEGKKVRVMEYDVCDFMRQCVTAYKEVCGDPNMKMRVVATPFLPPPDGGGDAYLGPEDPSDEQKGTLASKASSILMKVLYGARAARWDLLKIVQVLATRVTKWTVECDRALHRLMCYINCTAEYTLRGYVGDNSASWRLRLFADADFAGERPGYKSTSGAFLVLAAPFTNFPISAKCAKQTSVSHSTPEAEIVSAAAALRLAGLPTLDLFETVLKRLVYLELMEDNQSTIQIIKTGRNPTMRHISRTHGVNVAWLHDCYVTNKFGMIYQKTDGQSADIFTKAFRDAEKWKHACDLIGVGNWSKGGGKITPPPAAESLKEATPSRDPAGGKAPAAPGRLSRRQRRAVRCRGA